MFSSENLGPPKSMETLTHYEKLCRQWLCVVAPSDILEIVWEVYSSPELTGEC